MEQNKKVVLITGTSSGFGLLIAKTLARSAYIVAACMRDITGKNKQVVSDLKNWAVKEEVKIHLLEMDVSRDESVNKSVTELIEREGQIDIVVNNAGIAAMGYSESYTNEQVRYLFDVNVIGSNRVIHAVLPHMRMQKSGLIIQISSLAAALPMPYHGHYPATKLAIETIVESYKYELAPFGIDVAIIQPGGFPTLLINNAIKPDALERIQEYGEYAGIPDKIFSGSIQVLSGSNAPNPQAVADAVKRLIESGPGKRPLRTIVDEFGIDAVTNAAQSINSHAEKTKIQLMKDMGFDA